MQEESQSANPVCLMQCYIQVDSANVQSCTSFQLVLLLQILFLVKCDFLAMLL